MFFFFEHTPYIAIVGDIISSKKLESRADNQEKLENVLHAINKKYSDDIASNFTITLGDEFQGLLHHGASAMAIILEIERKMYPVKIRFGIGVGEITTRIDRAWAIGADGPAYYRARAAVDYLKQNEKKNRSGKADIRLEMDEENQPAADLINTIFSLMTAIKNAWSKRQRETIWDMLEHQDNQLNAAQRLDITQSSVHKNLANGNFYEYKEALGTIEKALGNINV